MGLSGCGCGDGVLYDQTLAAYTNGIAPGQKLQLYWFPSVTLASNTVGATYYGEYSDTNSPPLDGSDAWQMPVSDSSAHLIFWTALYGGSNPKMHGQATRLANVPPLASFTASPTYGTAPLAVTFIDTSTGTIINRFWDFGDSSTTNTTTNSVTHSYAAGTFTVSLAITGPGGVSTNTQLNCIATTTPFHDWQVQYFGSPTNPAAAADADPDGDGQNNMAEFLAGTDPTNSASAFRIISIARQGQGFRVTWMSGIGTTNVLQVASGDDCGGYSDNFIDLFGVTNAVGATTNYLDAGAATNFPARYYRVRLVP